MEVCDIRWKNRRFEIETRVKVGGGGECGGEEESIRKTGLKKTENILA